MFNIWCCYFGKQGSRPHITDVDFSRDKMREAPWSSGKALALDAARPRSIPGLGDENY